jgi:hypothetical protein
MAIRRLHRELRASQCQIHGLRNVIVYIMLSITSVAEPQKWTSFCESICEISVFFDDGISLALDLGSIGSVSFPPYMTS